MAEKNTNLRVLAQAYSNGKLTKDQYEALRSKQLSAIEFGKPFPPLPPGLSTVNVPNLKIEAPKGGKGKAPIIAAAIALTLLLLGLVAFIIMQSGEKTDTATTQTEQSLENKAQLLIGSDDMATKNVVDFIKHWKKIGEQQQKLHRKAAWFAPLQTEVEQAIKDINTVKQLSAVNAETENKAKSTKDLEPPPGPSSRQYPAQNQWRSNITSNV